MVGRRLQVLQGKGLRRASLNESLAASAAAEAALAAARNLGGEYADDEPSVSAKERVSGSPLLVCGLVRPNLEL